METCSDCKHFVENHECMSGVDNALGACLVGFNPEDPAKPDSMVSAWPCNHCLIHGVIPRDEPVEQLGLFEKQIDKVLAETKDMLVAKNRQYGNSALDPVRIFSRADAREQLAVRIDDKLSRLMRGNNDTEDTRGDLLGYLILYRIAEQMVDK